MTYDLAIKGGMVVDGAGNPRQQTDVAVHGGRIARIGRVAASEAAVVIDASGLIVAPGFIDLHTHYDAQIFWDPYVTTSGWHGVTSVVIGNCGFGFAPVRPDERERAMLTMTAVEAIPTETLRDGLRWDWVTFPEYLDTIERTPLAVNALAYVPLNPLLVWVLGLDAAKAGKRPNDREHHELARLLREALEAGACGWSAQCLGQPGQPNAQLPQADYDGTPMPTDIMWPETRRVAAEVLAGWGSGFMQASGVPDAEVEALVELSGRPYIWQAIVANERTGYYKPRLDWLARCRAKGLPIYGQAMTTDAPIRFTLQNTGILDRSPLAKVHAVSTLEDKVAILRDPAFRTELSGFQSIAFNAFGDMLLAQAFGPTFAPFAGMQLGDIAAKVGGSPVDVMCDASIEDGLQAVFQTQQFHATLEGLRRLVDDRYLIPGLSDGGAHVSFLSTGCYGTEYIARYVRDYEWTTLEEAHWRLSGLSAHCGGFRDRGVLREGAAADIIVYDFADLDYGDVEFIHDLPAGQMRSIARAKGYRHIVVNGRVTVENDRETGTTSGRLLRHGRAV